MKSGVASLRTYGKDKVCIVIVLYCFQKVTCTCFSPMRDGILSQDGKQKTKVMSEQLQEDQEVTLRKVCISYL